MALVVKTSTIQNVTLPLACDPAVLAANPRPEPSPQKDGEPAQPMPPWSLALYRRTSDVNHPAARLVVPPDACRVTLRPLSKRELLQTAAAAGERPEADAVIWADTVEAISAELKADRGAPNERVMTKLTAEQRAAYERHDEWELRHAIEIARAGLVQVSDLPDLKRGPAGFPVEQLIAMDDPAPGSDLRWPPGLDSTAVLMEVAQHVVRISTLGKALGPSSGSASGAPTNTPSGGGATALDGATGTSPAPGQSQP